jgi:hypothetical protein
MLVLTCSIEWYMIQRIRSEKVIVGRFSFLCAPLLYKLLSQKRKQKAFLEGLFVNIPEILLVCERVFSFVKCFQLKMLSRLFVVDHLTWLKIYILDNCRVL